MLVQYRPMLWCCVCLPVCRWVPVGFCRGRCKPGEYSSNIFLLCMNNHSTVVEKLAAYYSEYRLKIRIDYCMAWRRKKNTRNSAGVYIHSLEQACRRPFVCLCLWVTNRCSTKGLNATSHKQHPHNRPGTQVFWCQRSQVKFAPLTPPQQTTASRRKLPQRGTGRSRARKTNLEHSHLVKSNSTTTIWLEQGLKSRRVGPYRRATTQT